METTTTLESLLNDKGPLSWEQAMEILVSLVAILSELHRQGRALGNLHPGQILFDEAGGISIGALNGLEDWQPDDSQRPLIYYQSPEQLQGESPTPFSDQFSLAILFQEMISGQLPFDSQDESWLRHLILAEPPALLPTDLDLPFGVGAVLHRALAKAPEQRFEDVLAFSWALEALAASSTTAESKVDFKRSSGRHIYSVLGVAAVIALAAAFFFINQKGVTFWDAPIPTASPAPTQVIIAINHTATPTATPIPKPKASPTIITRSTAEGGGVLAAVKPTVTPTATGTKQPTPTPIPTPTPTPMPMAEVVRQANLRRGPATTHPLVVVAKKGMKFPIVGRTSNGSWLQLRLEGSDAWIAAHLVKIHGNANAVAIVVHPPTPPPPPIAKIPPVLLSPAPGWITTGGETTFAWQWPGDSLPEGYGFALLFWREGQPKDAIVTMVGPATQVSYNPFTAPVVQQNGPGRYYWSVVVVRSATNEIIGTDSEPRLLILQAQESRPPSGNDGDRGGNDGGGGGGGDDGGNGDNDGSDGESGGGNPPPPSQRTPTPRPDDPS